MQVPESCGKHRLVLSALLVDAADQVTGDVLSYEPVVGDVRVSDLIT